MEHFAELEERGRVQLRADGIDPAQARLARSADIRYKGQINEVEVPVPGGTLDASALAQLVSDFHRRYETVYGQGAGFREARVEVVTYRVRASAVSAKPRIVAAPEADRAPSREASARTPRLAHGSDRERSRWELIGGGVGIHWPELDEDISVEGLLAGRRSGEAPQSLKRWLSLRVSARAGRPTKAMTRRPRR